MAKDNMAKGDFVKAEQLWEKLCSKTENEKYYIQQRALCRYKSEVPSTQRALTDAMLIMAENRKPNRYRNSWNFRSNK